MGGEPRPQPTDRRRGHRPDRALSSPVRQNAAAAIGVRPASTVLAYPERMAYERITIDPARMRGLPCIRDTRVTVSAVLGQLAAGQSAEQILADYPYLERADILAALEFAADALQEHELPLARPA